MTNRDRGRRPDARLTSRSRRKIRKKLSILGADDVRDDIEMSVARAAFQAHDYQGTTALVPTILAGLALVVAVSDNVEASTAILATVAIAGFLGLLASVHIAKRNQEAANAVLHYRIDHHLPILEPDGDDTNVAEG